MEKQKLLKNLRHRLGLLLCLMAFLAVGQGAWATLYVYGSAENNDDVNSYTYLGETDGLSFTWNTTFTDGRWRRIIFEKSKTGGKSGFQNDGIYCKSASRDESKFSGASSQEWGEVYSLQFTPSSTLTSVTITISTNPSSKSCNFEKKSGVYCADYSVTAGSPTCTYYFRHQWDGTTWGNKKATDNGDGTYTLTEILGKRDGSFDISLSSTGSGTNFPIGNIIYENSPQTGDRCLYTYIPKNTDCTIAGPGTNKDVLKVTKITDGWELRGEFTNWSTNPIAFTGTGNTLSCTANITAGEYKQGQAGKGFKILKNGSAWYGARTTMTRENNTATFQTGSGDSWNCGLNADITGNYTFTITNLSGDNPELTITYPSQTYSIARWGAAPTIDGSKNINASAYVATHGCNGSSDYTVTQLKVRYWKEGDEANSEVKETTTGTYTPGTAYPIVIPYTSNVLMNCTTESKIIMEVACKNGLGWSAYSDRMAVMYTAGTTFVTENLTKSFTACEGNHQFTLSDMVKPVPDSWTVTSGGADAKSEFTLADGEMIWNPGDKTTGQYVYNFTFKKAGYEVDGTATLTINYTKTAPEGAVTISASKTAATKYEEVTLTATKGTGVEKIKWSVTPDTYITTTNSDGTNATFQGKAIKTYTVTAVGLSESCGEKAAHESITINVSKDTEECHE